MNCFEEEIESLIVGTIRLFEMLRLGFSIVYIYYYNFASSSQKKYHTRLSKIRESDKSKSTFIQNLSQFNDQKNQQKSQENSKRSNFQQSIHIRSNSKGIKKQMILYNQWDHIQSKARQMQNRKQNTITQWRQNNHSYYDFVYQNILDWPVTSVQWGPLIQQNSQYIQQRLYFSCKTDGIYNIGQNNWTNTPNYIVMANMQIPNEQHYFINQLKALFNYDSAKKHPNLKVKQIITHPGQVTVIRSSPMNRKLLASKSDNNTVYLWTSDKYKLGNVNNMPSTPDMILMATKSQKNNYALRFTPSLPKIISASADKLQVFDIEGPPVKRQLGSVLSSNIIKPIITLEGHDKVEDVAFKNNQICVSGGQDRQIGVWDLRINYLCQKISSIHDSDINTVACKGNFILSGGQEGRINIIDDRTYKVVQKFQLEKPIHGIQFNPVTSHFAVGRQYLQIYSLDKTLEEHKMTPLFTHLGMRGNIHEFDWNTESSMTLATTYQEFDIDISAQGGFIHVFKPLDIFFQKKTEGIQTLKAAFESLNAAQREEIMNYVNKK